MNKFRAKPIEVEAVRWDGTKEQAAAICRPHGYVMQYLVEDKIPFIAVATVHGSVEAYAGDWIVSAHGADLRVVSPENFAMEFEEAKP